MQLLREGRLSAASLLLCKETCPPFPADGTSLQVGAEVWRTGPGGLSASLPNWLLLEESLPLTHWERVSRKSQGSIAESSWRIEGAI